MHHPLVTLLSWLATYLLHSTLLLGGALLVARAVRGPAAREVLWKGALLGGLVTATLHGVLGPRPGMGRFDLALSPGGGPAPIALQLAGAAHLSGELAAMGARDPAASLTDAAQVRTAPGSAAPQAVQPARWPGLLAGAWALGVLVLLATFLRERRRMHRLFAARRPVREPEPRAALAQLLAQARSRRRVRLTTCPGIGSPVALGSSEICLPERAGRDLALGELRALLAHELAHLERRDGVWLTAIHVLERVLFPQPLNRIVRRRLQSDVEMLCDDSAARRLGRPADLARCLARVAGWMESALAPALATGMAHAPSQLVARVERLLGPRSEPRRGANATAALGVCLVLAAVGVGGPGVTTPPALDQETPAEARLLRVVATMRIVAGHPVVHYGVGEFETTELGNLGRHLALLHARYPEAGIAIAPHVEAEALTALVDEVFEHFDAILVEGEGPEPDALRAEVVRRKPVRLSLRVVKSGLRLDPGSGEPWRGEDGSLVYDETRTIEYALDDRKVCLLGEAEKLLRELHARRPRTRIRLECGPGTIYPDCVSIVHAAVEAGFTDIRFSGTGARIDTEKLNEDLLEYDTAEPNAEIEQEVVRAEVVPGRTDAGSSDGGSPMPLDFEGTPAPITLDIDGAGRMHAEGALLHESPEGEATWSDLRAWLAGAAAGMEKAPARSGAGGLRLSDEPLLIRAAPEAAFRHVQRVMELCARREVQIWKIELAAPEAGVAPVPIWLPIDPGLVGEQPAPLTLDVRVAGAPGEDDRLEYAIGAWKTTRLAALRSALARLRVRRTDLRLVIDPREGTTVLEVLRLVQAVRGEGYGPISFVGARPTGAR